MDLFVWTLLAYLLGSVPFGLILTRCAGAGDIRHIGSGNIGATNVLRTGKKGLALATLLLDGGKGALAVLIVSHYQPGLDQLAGFAAILGHLFPFWLGFKGGKGVATSFGVMTAIAWPVGLCGMLIWLGMAAAFRYSSLAALVSIASAPLLAVLFDRIETFWLFIALSVLVIVKHASNIKRLIDGVETKIGQKKE